MHALVNVCITGDIFCSFVIQLLQLFDSYHDSEHAVFHMDNTPVHKPTDLRQLFGTNKNNMMFALPYSAKMNSIEFLFSSWKCKANKMMKGKKTE